MVTQVRKLLSNTTNTTIQTQYRFKACINYIWAEFLMEIASTSFIYASSIFIAFSNVVFDIICDTRCSIDVMHIVTSYDVV